MQSMAISLADSLGRTARGDQELAQAQHGLSVAQRKLLGQLGSPGTLEAIARDNGWDADYANKTASRLVELGLVVAASEPRPAAEDALLEGESARVLPLARQAPALSKRWPAAAGAITIGAAVLIWWSLSSNTNSTVEQMVQTPKPAAGSTPAGAKPAEPAPVLAAKPTELPKAVYSMTLQQPQAPVAAAPAQSAPPAAPAAAAAPAAKATGTAPAAPAVATRGLASPARETAPAKGSAQTAAAPASTPAASAPAATPAPAATTAPAETRTVVAAAAPSASEAAKPAPVVPAETGLKIVQREAPGFPREALLANVTSGSVKVRMTVDGGGNVTKVDILEASPRRVFDREVQRTLARWKFEATGQTQTAETEVVFRRD